MPKYLITAISFIDNSLVQAGTEIDTDATPAQHWEPIDKAAVKSRKDFDAAEAASVESARIDAEALFIKENPANLTPLTPQDVAALQANEVAASAALAEAQAAEAKAAAELAAAELS
jgi:hypothetical protein